MRQEALNVLHVVCGLNLQGGAETVVRELAGLQLDGVNQTIWMHRDFHPRSGEVVVSRGLIQTSNRGIFQDLFAGLREAAVLVAWLRGRSGFVLHAHSRVGTIAASIAGVVLRIPVIHHCHTLPRHLWIYHWLVRLCRGQRIFNSTKTRKHYGDWPDDALILMPGLDNWKPADKEHAKQRFVAAGSFVPGKHLCDLVSAYRLLREEGFDAELHLHGAKPTSDRSAYEREIHELCADQLGVYLHEWNENWSKELSSGDIFVHLGHPESFGIVILEAFSKGLRLVVNRDTFLDDLPKPSCSAGIYRLFERSPRCIAKRMAEALAEDPSEDFAELRKSVRGRFGAIERSDRLRRFYTNARKRAA